MPSIKAAFAFIAGIVVLGLCGLVWLLSERLDTISRQLEVTTQTLNGVVRGLGELERKLKAAAVREDVRTDTREIIIAAPETDNGAVAPVLLEGLRGADRIGAVE